MIYKLGVGNLLAAALGFPTMIIAYYLTFDNDGDTIGVMQAVLDTNFWLATHVVCITLGYATTLLAGALGDSHHRPRSAHGETKRLNQRKQLTRMTYGTICFAIFFSFIGTILGGLWADDSWGRFWGWDPKENGALMIVIWNAIVLHARWGRWSANAAWRLAVCGNIVTLWSWFGVNEMGVGLHSYGFTEGRAFWLANVHAEPVGDRCGGVRLAADHRGLQGMARHAGQRAAAPVWVSGELGTLFRCRLH